MYKETVALGSGSPARPRLLIGKELTQAADDASDDLATGVPTGMPPVRAPTFPDFCLRQDTDSLNILVLSPHRDDAAFSLTLSLQHWLAAGHQVTVMNVFTRSLYAPYADAEKVPQHERLDFISALRKREDIAALKKIGVASVIDLDIKDAPIRLDCDSSIVCDMEVVPHDRAIPKVRKALEAELARQQHATKQHEAKQQGGDQHAGDQPTGDQHALVLPLGLGHHVDHRTARDAALPLSQGVPCAFYEELPYATRDGVRVDLSRFREDAATRLHEPLFPVLCHGTHTRPTELKRSIALMYESQIDRELADVIAGFSHRYHGAERLWANEAWLAIAAKHKLSTRQRDVNAEPLPA